MKKYFISLVFLFAALSLSAQTTVVTGSVVDSLSRVGEPSAVLQFFKLPDREKPIAFTTADIDGNFSQALSGTGDYVAMYGNVGRKTVYKAFSIAGEETLSIGEILVQDDVETLEAGRVVALKTLVKMDVDKMTYKVEDDVDSKTSTVLEMLRKVPMVSVDGEDNITVNGSSSFQVLVDGKPNVMISSNPSQVFKSMPASFIKDIQVITNPGVKYDAEGVGGVLNITTVKAQNGGASMPQLDGYNATIGLNGSSRFDNGLGYGIRTFITGQKGKFSYSANLNLNRNNMLGTESSSIQSQLDAAGNVVSSTANESTMSSKNLMGMASVDLGYEIDNLRLVSASFGLMSMGMNSLSEQLTSMTFGPMSMGYSNTMNSDSKMNSITAGVDYQRSFANNPDKSFVFSYQLSSRPMISNSETLFEKGGTSMFDLTDRRSDGITNTLQNTFQVDYSDKWLGSLTFNAGAKYINRLNKSDQSQYFSENGAWVLNELSSVDYSHNNDIAAAYTQLSYAVGNFSAKGGVRYEHTFQSISYADGKGNSLKVNYGDLVPSASIQYNITMQQNIGLSYNMRIRRPGISYLDPYVDISDPTRRMYGNPDLETEKANTINLVYNYFNQKVMINATLRDTWCGNGISNYTFYDKDGLLNTTYGNILKSNTLGANIYANINIGTKTRIMLNGSAGYSTMDNPMLGLHNDGFNGMGMLGLQQTIPWDVRLSANLIATSSNKSVDGWRSGMSMAMCSLTKTFFDDKLTVAVSGTVPIAKGLKMVMESHTAGPDYKIDSKNVMPMSQASLNITWAFGNKKGIRIKRARTSIHNDDLMDSRGESSDGAEGMSGSGSGSGAGAGAAAGGAMMSM